MLEIKDKNYWKFLAGILVFALFLRLFFPTGLLGSADVSHDKYAYQIVSGTYSPTEADVHYSTRITYIYPVAFFYRIFGVSEFSSYLFSLITSLLGILLVYWLGSFLLGREVGLIAAFLLSFYPLDVINSTAMLPDIPHSFFMGIAVLAFLVGRRASAGWRKSALYVSSGISAGIAYYMKTSGLLVFIFMAAFGLYELFFLKRKMPFIRRIEWGYMLILAGFMVVFFAAMLHNYSVSGNPFLTESQFEHEYSTAMKNLYDYSGARLFERLFFHFPYLVLTNFQFGFFFIFILMASGYYVFFKRTEGTTTVLLWLYGMFLYINFGPTTFNLGNYIPLAAGSPRYLAVLSFPAVLILASFLSEKDKIIKKYLAPFAVIFLLLTSLGFIYLNPDRGSRSNAKEALDFLSKQGKSGIVVYVDGASYPSYAFLSGYKSTENIKIYLDGNYPYKGSSSINFSEVKNAYIIIDWQVLNSIPKNYGWSFPEEIIKQQKGWKLLKEIKNTKGNAYIYYVQ
ncbi:glycosyltransferase family 39 protein [Candidatus Woesearchaeota archaeon]|nr:glycosyltransferase family 39 protein [Candidatus Woesearchaeota archaeon]